MKAGPAEAEAYAALCAYTLTHGRRGGAAANRWSPCARLNQDR